MARGLTLQRTLISVVLIGVAVGVGGAILGVLASMRKPPEKSAKFDLHIAVRTSSAQRQSYREELNGYGKARAMRRTSVAAEVTGLVVKISPRLEAGNAVAAGEELVWLDDRDLKDAVESIGARLDRNDAERLRLTADAASIGQQIKLAAEELRVANRELARVEKLLERGVATTSDSDAESLRVMLRRTAVLRLDGDRNRNDAQQASTAAARKELDVSLRQARTNLDRAVIRAPYAGRIESRTAQKGAHVGPGTMLFEILDPTRVEIPVALPASRHGQVAVGTDALVRVPGGDADAWTAKIVRLAPLVRADDRTFVVYLESTGDNAVPPGAFVVARIPGRQYDNVFVIPRTAFVGKRIFVVEGDIARELSPHIVRSLPGVILCDGGIEEGDAIIVTNLEQVADGTTVAVSGEPAGAEDDDA